MNIEDIIKQVANLNCSNLSQEIISHNTRKIIENFNNTYKITPKEQWCVTFTRADNINYTTAQGPFDSQEIAEEFATIWNERRDEYIEKTIEEDPDGDYEFYYVKAKAVQLFMAHSTKKILDEILNKG